MTSFPFPFWLCPFIIFYRYTEPFLIQIETSTKMYTPFLPEWIKDMDHMRISGTEPNM